MVKCADCGFLSVRHNDTRELCEAERQPDGTVKADRHYVNGLLCFKALRDFGGPEVTHHEKSVGVTIDWSVVYDRAQDEIDCRDGFLQRIPGLSPKEHLAMMDQERTRAWQLERETADREWRERQTESDRKWRREERRLRIIELAVLTVGLIFGGVVAAVVGALIARS